MVDATTVIEGDSSAMICATMETNPNTATLEKEVVVTLSTEDNTSKQSRELDFWGAFGINSILSGKKTGACKR